MAMPKSPGRLVATPGALDLLAKLGVQPVALVVRQMSGDLGDLCDEDKKANEKALTEGGRLFSSYLLANGAKVWVITEPFNERNQRLCTTILLPHEY